MIFLPLRLTKERVRKRGRLRVFVCEGHLLRQQGAAGDSVLQFDDGDEGAVLSLIVARVAERQRVIL